MLNENESPLAPLIGQKAHGCWLGHGAALFLEFGEPQPLGPRQRHPCGEWSLRSDLILWRIDQGDRVLGGSEDNHVKSEAAVEQINGRVLISGHISTFTGDTVLEFSDGLILRTFLLSSEDDARWNFKKFDGEYTPLGPLLAVARERES